MHRFGEKRGNFPSRFLRLLSTCTISAASSEQRNPANGVSQQAHPALQRLFNEIRRFTHDGGHTDQAACAI